MKKLNYFSALFTVASVVCCGQNFKRGVENRGNEKLKCLDIDGSFGLLASDFFDTSARFISDPNMNQLDFDKNLVCYRDLFFNVDHIAPYKEVFRNVDGGFLGLQDVYGNTLLHLAVLQGNIGALGKLLIWGAPVNATNDDRNTPLHFAIERGNPLMVFALLFFGADVNKPNRDGNTPLHFAVEKGNLEIVKKLLEYGATVDVCNSEDSFPLFTAILNKRYDIAEVLLSVGQSNDRLWNQWNTNPLCKVRYDLFHVDREDFPLLPSMLNVYHMLGGRFVLTPSSQRGRFVLTIPVQR